MRNGVLGCALFISGLAAFAACGSSTTPNQPSSSALTSAQITSIETAFVTVANTVTGALISELESGDETATGSTVPINVSSPCATSGTVSLTGSITLLSGGGTGANTASLGTSGPIVLTACTSGGVALSGSLNETGQLNLSGLNSTPIVVNPVTFSITGTNSFVLAGVTGSMTFACTNNLTFTPNTFVDPPPTPTVTSTGNVTLQYPTGQNSTTAPCSAFAMGLTFG